MGWYGDDGIKCPNCWQTNAVESYRNSLLDHYTLVCPDCGLCLYCKERKWVISSSYINHNLIGRDPKNLDPHEIVDPLINNRVLPEGQTLPYYKVWLTLPRVIAIAIGIFALLIGLQFLPN